MSSAGTTGEIEELLELLKRSRGFDFSGYKRPSLVRRIDKRLHAVGVRSYADYMRLLEREPGEYDQLFNTVLINVTDFFRDGPPWDFLAKHVMPKILGGKDGDGSVRIWSAGCATGQEAYS